MKKNIIIGALMLILGFAIGILCRPKQTERVVDIQRDTIIYRDTIRETYPIEISKEVVRKEYVVVRDTSRIKDTLYLSLPMERRVYGSDDFYAEVTGYKPSLDRLEVYLETQTVTKYVMRHEPPKRWGIGVQAGYGVAASGGTIRLAPYIGIGISYDIVRW